MEPQYYLNTYRTKPLTKRILELIKGATTYIKTGNFFFREPAIQEELVNASRRGVIVFILSNLRQDENRLAAGNRSSKAEYDPHIPNLMELVEEGAHVRCVSELHAKFIITDGEEGMIMSSNYTVNSLHGNPECGADLSAGDTEYLERVFDTIFMHADTRLVGRGSNAYLFKFTDDPIQPDVFDNQDTDIVMTLAGKRERDRETGKTNFASCNIQGIYHELANIINDSEKFVYLAAYSFRSLKKLPLIRNAIINAANRGVSMNLIYRIDLDDTRSEIDKLIQRAPSIHAEGFPENHAKFLLTDKDGFLFTANIDGEAGLLNGFELGVYLNDTQYQQAKDGLNALSKEKEEINKTVMQHGK